MFNLYYSIQSKYYNVQLNNKKIINLQLIIKSSSSPVYSNVLCSLLFILMLTDFSQTKTYKSKTQISQQPQQHLNQNHQPYINPIIKHTIDSLPIIYGGNLTRKRKYNLFMKSKFELNNIISKAHDKNYLPNQRLYKKLNNLQQDRLRGYSCLEMNQKKQFINNERQQIAKTVVKKNKRLSTQPEHGSSNNQKCHHGLATPKNKKLVNLEAMHMLSKPRDKCNKQYCYCKSLYDEYQEQIKKKMKQKNNSIFNRKQNNQSLQKIQFPKLLNEQNHKSLSKLDDQESKHKVGFRHKINSMQDQNRNNDDCCYLCKKNKNPNQKVEAKGILGLIKKKQIEQKRNKLHIYSSTQNIGIQIGPNQLVQPQAQNQNFGIQADIIQNSNKIKTIDQQINTDFDEQNNGFKYLQNNKNLKQSHLKQNKKQPMQHLSHLKQKYKYKKRPSYQSKYGLNEGNSNDQNNHSYDDQSDTNCKHENNLNYQKNNKKTNTVQQQDQYDINMSTSSVVSQSSLMNHLADALVANGNDRSTIFKVLKKKQKQQSDKQIIEKNGKHKRTLKSKKQYKKMNLISQDTGLFSIPQEQQYVDYLKSYQPIQKDFKIKNLIKSQNFKVLKYKDTLYFGLADPNNTKNGKALFISPRQIFQGIYQNGIKMSGCQKNIDGIYMGDFLNGMRHGNGKWIWNNGQIYEGEWKLGTKNGHGIWKSPKGDYYEGQWVMNRQQGKGIHKHKSSVYEGEFVQALKQGLGKQTYINGDQYIGQYYQGKPHGKGKYVWKNGTYYDGQFKDGLRQGFGKLRISDKAYYEGQFKNDFKNGKGKQFFENGDYYEGQYVEGVKTNGVFKQFSTGKITQIKVSNTSRQQQQKTKEAASHFKVEIQQKIPQNKHKQQSNNKQQKNAQTKEKVDQVFQSSLQMQSKKDKIIKENKEYQQKQKISLKNSKVQIKVEQN